MKIIKQLFQRKLKTICERCTTDRKYPHEITDGLCRGCFVEMAKIKYDKKIK